MPAKPSRKPNFPDVSEAIAEIRKAGAGGRGRRSPLYVWLRDSHDQLVREFERAGPAWDALAVFLGARGVLDGYGRKPTGRGTRAVWFRVRADLKAASEKRASEPAPPLGVTFATLAPDQTSAPAPASTDAWDYQAGPRPTFKLATMRNATPADGPKPPEPLTTTTVPEPALDQTAIEERLAQFLGKPVPAGFLSPKRDEGDE